MGGVSHCARDVLELLCGLVVRGLRGLGILVRLRLCCLGVLRILVGLGLGFLVGLGLRSLGVLRVLNDCLLTAKDAKNAKRGSFDRERREKREKGETG